MDLMEQGGRMYRHPWEISRGDSICRILERILQNPSQQRIADIGAGDRYIAKRVKELSERNHWNHQLVCVDAGYSADDDGCEVDGIVSFRELKPEWKGTFDVVLLLDVAEHVEDDASFVEEVQQLLNEHGVLLMTAPAFPMLYSAHDQHLKHYRRYRRRELCTMLSLNGLQVETSHFFYTPLLLIRLLQKVTTLKTERDIPATGLEGWPYPRRHAMTRLIGSVLDIDFCFHERIARWGWVVPGLSILVKAVKQSV